VNWRGVEIAQRYDLDSTYTRATPDGAVLANPSAASIGPEEKPARFVTSVTGHLKTSHSWSIENQPPERAVMEVV
jgi:hypothetical protein